MYELSSPEIVSVDKNGNITAHKEGTVTITAVTEDGEKIASCEVTVVAKGQLPQISYITVSGEGNEGRKVRKDK